MIPFPLLEKTPGYTTYPIDHTDISIQNMLGTGGFINGYTNSSEQEIMFVFLNIVLAKRNIIKPAREARGPEGPAR